MKFEILCLWPKIDISDFICEIIPKTDIYLSLAKISLCSGDMRVSSDNAGGGVANKAAVGAVFSFPKRGCCWALRDKFPQESMKKIEINLIKIENEDNS